LALEEREEVEWMLKEVFVSWLVSNEWGGRKGLIYYSPKTSRYYAESGILGTTDTVSVLPRGFSENQQWSFIGSSDTGSVLPTPWLKLASEAISVLPTRCRYYRQWLRVWDKISKSARVNSKLFLLTWDIS
jgi:hypothetical protein